MNLAVAQGPSGFAMQPGARYRVLASIPSDAFRVLPWDAPSAADITMSLGTAGLTDIALVMPWESAPSDWPSDAPLSENDAFVVRADGTWNGGATLAPSVAIHGSQYPASVTRVWLHAAAPAVPATPAAPSVPTQPTPRVPPVSPRPKSSSPATPPDPLPAPAAPPRRGLSPGAKVALGGGAIAAATLLVAHGPFRRSRTA